MNSTHLVIHEVKPNGQHRIVVIQDDLPIPGEWAAADELATHEPFGKVPAYYANTDFGNDLPGGVFAVKEVAHQVLA